MRPRPDRVPTASETRCERLRLRVLPLRDADAVAVEPSAVTASYDVPPQARCGSENLGRRGWTPCPHEGEDDKRDRNESRPDRPKGRHSPHQRPDDDEYRGQHSRTGAACKKQSEPKERRAAEDHDIPEGALAGGTPFVVEDADHDAQDE